MENKTNISLIAKLKENFRNNKKIWILAIVLVVFVLFLSFSKMWGFSTQKTPTICKTGDIFNIENGELCPGQKVPRSCEPGDLFNKETGKKCS